MTEVLALKSNLGWEGLVAPDGVDNDTRSAANGSGTAVDEIAELLVLGAEESLGMKAGVGWKASPSDLAMTWDEVSDGADPEGVANWRVGWTVENSDVDVGGYNSSLALQKKWRRTTTRDEASL